MHSKLAQLAKRMTEIDALLASGAVQSSTGDWTPIYNVKNLQAKAEGRLQGMAYGESHASGRRWGSGGPASLNSQLCLSIQRQFRKSIASIW